ncbi:hypothetical protein Rhopal_004472-T1 [Rhodotorula paludigena]|uniref:Uncharacterized protein n=1 Tax=Rhodotorula paludigena TaxID=86838 RepID=A0AAV5GLT3_9BASI|nr:hypothetical protein Rhopal_004472-T1 [Rhodotorula paludigena]
MTRAAAYAYSLLRASVPSPDVLVLALARPPVNAFSTDLFAQLRDAFAQASRDEDVRCVVLTSDVGKGFTAGLDLHASDLMRQASDPARTALLLRDHIDHLQRCVSAIQDCEKPVVCAVHGLCFGAGIDIMSACDVRYCAEGSIFSIKEVDIGLAADIGSLQRLPKVTGNASLVAEYALTARNFGPPEAERMGLVSATVGGGKDGVRDKALEVARVIASKSPIATLSTKHLLNYSREHTVQEGLQYTQAWNMAMIQASDIPAAFEAFATKKPAKFEKLAKL